MQLTALAAADLGLKRGREEERILRQLQGLRAGIRRVRGDDDPGVLELGGEMHVQPIAAIVKAFERRLTADGRQPGTGYRRYCPSLAVQRALQGDDDVLAGVRIRFSVPGPGKSEPCPGQRYCRVLKTAAGAQERSAGLQAVADRGVGSLVIVSCARQYVPRVRRGPDPQ